MFAMLTVNISNHELQHAVFTTIETSCKITMYEVGSSYGVSKS